jgi:hypothetical protein
MPANSILRLRRAAVLGTAFVLTGALAAGANSLRVPNGGSPEGAVKCAAGNPNTARFGQSCGALVTLVAGDTAPAYTQDNSPAAEGTYRVRFYANLRTLTMGNGSGFDLFAAYDGADPTPPANAGNAALRLEVQQSAGKKQLVAYARLNSGNESSLGTPVPLPDGWRSIEVNWSKATGAGANNGALALWVDGKAQTTLSGLNNDSETINYVRWGAVAGLDAGMSGSFRLDDFTSQRTGYVGPVSVFSDEPTTDAFWPYIQGLYSAEITTGCAPQQFCPFNNVSRAEMAVFLVRAMHGPAFVPPAAVGIFTDVPTTSFGADYIEQLFADGITTGCAPQQYCPANNVSRAEMAVFLLRAKHGRSYVPPAGTGTLFIDVSASFWADAWIERLFAEGITTGCAPSQYCPGDSVLRLQMAAFLCRTFAFPQPQIGP